MALSAPLIVCAALELDGYIIVGPRHFDHVMQPHLKLWREANGFELDAGHKFRQGFVDQHGKFHTRGEAWVIAEANGQLRRRFAGDGPVNGLFSENLY